jgi:hypothetical protein
MLPVLVLANNIEVTKLSLIVSKQEVASFQIQHIGVKRERIVERCGRQLYLVGFVPDRPG